MAPAPASDPREPLATLPPDATSRYELLEKVASGGMATVYVGRQRGAEGFWRLVAIKRPHQHLLDDPGFRRMFVDEARLASRIHHPNVVPVLDVEERPGGQLLLVMDYVEGASLAELIDASGATGRPMPTRNAVRIALDALSGLHAAHELTDARGRSVRLVHRDVSPHNVLVGIDGTGRVADFGIAKSVATKNVTESGVLKGKLAYMAPEYIERQICDARSDVFAMAIVLWESIAGRRLFRGDSDYDTLRRIVKEEAPLLSTVAPWTQGLLDGVLAAALERDPERRTASARLFADTLEAVARRHDLVASPAEVGDHLRRAMEAPLARRREKLRRFLDAGGTTGPMDAAHVELARATPMREVPAAATPSAILISPDPAGEPTPSSAVTRSAADLTERALVAAGIRAPRRASGGVVVVALVGLAAVVGGTLWFRGRGAPAVDPSAPSSRAETSTALPASASPRVAPLAEPDLARPVSAPSASAPAASAEAPPSPSAPAPAACAAASRPRSPPAAPPSPPPARPSAPSPAPPGLAPPGGASTAPAPIRDNPYR